MRPLSVTIQNFLSFGPAQEISLDRQGMLAVFGQNKDSAGADSNGAGKSAIPEAIVWVLYGETMRGFKADDVVNRVIGKDCYVQLTLEDGGFTYVVERTRKLSGRKSPNSLNLRIVANGEIKDISGGTNSDTQQQILTLVGMDFATFTQAVMLSHGTRPFSTMTDKESQQVLEDIMRTDTVTRAQALTKSRVLDRQGQLTQIRMGQMSLRQQISDGEVRISKLTSQRDQHATLMEDRRTELTLRRVDIEIRLEDIYVRTGLDALIALQNHQKEELGVVETRLSEIRQQELALTQEAGEKRTELAREEGMVVGRLRQIASDLQRLNQLVGNPCPTCKQVLPPDAADGCMQTWSAESKQLQGKLDGFTKKRTRIDQALDKAVARVTADKVDVEKRVNELRGLLQGTASDIQKRGADLQSICDLEQQIFNLDAEIEALVNSANPYQGLINQVEAEIGGKKAELRSLDAREHILDVQLRHLNFLVTAFSNQGLKSYVLDTVVPQLTERAQEHLDVLSGGDITIRFSTQTQLKGGGLANRFQVQAVNRFGADVYQGNSAGEKKRVDWAVALALGDLAATRASKQIKFKGLDEPFENLDETGEDSVIRLLHRLVSEYETIMVITHSAHLQSQFQNQLSVVKENGVSRMV